MERRQTAGIADVARDRPAWSHCSHARPPAVWRERSSADALGPFVASAARNGPVCPQLWRASFATQGRPVRGPGWRLASMATGSRSTPQSPMLASARATFRRTTLDVTASKSRPQLLHVPLLRGDGRLRRVPEGNGVGLAGGARSQLGAVSSGRRGGANWGRRDVRQRIVGRSRFKSSGITNYGREGGHDDYRTAIRTDTRLLA